MSLNVVVLNEGDRLRVSFVVVVDGVTLLVENLCCWFDSTLDSSVFLGCLRTHESGAKPKVFRALKLLFAEAEENFGEVGEVPVDAFRKTKLTNDGDFAGGVIKVGGGCGVAV